MFPPSPTTLAALAGLTRFTPQPPQVALWEPLGSLIVTWARSPGQTLAVGHRERRGLVGAF